jgi:hypothetical protein
MKTKRRIAWGASPLLELYLRHVADHGIEFCIDKSESLQGRMFEGIPVYSPEKLMDEDTDQILIIITAMSSASIQSIHEHLSERGYEINRNYVDFAAFLKKGFQARAEAVFARPFSEGNFTFARTFNMNSRTPLETTVLGNWLLLEALQQTSHLTGSIAEVGAYKGGNAYLQLSAMSLMNDSRTYYVFDSFQGFADLSSYDPRHLQKVYDYDYKVNHIFNSLKIFSQALVVPGFVPKTFSGIDDAEKFSLVFYDCDLYQPALDTYNFFWDKIEPGGILVIHDNIATKDGWGGSSQGNIRIFRTQGNSFSRFLGNDYVGYL